MIILHSFDDNLSLTIPGDDVADFLATLQGPYLEVNEADLPDAPREAWMVDWEAGTVTVNPAWITPTAIQQPAYSAAWADLITSLLYQRALGLAFAHLGVNTAMTTFGIAFQAHRDLPHEIWAGALSAATGHLATAINTTPYPLTEAEMNWIADWSERHHLNLTFPWELANG